MKSFYNFKNVKRRERYRIMKEFFSITDDKYIFEIWDITTLVTVLNVAFVLMGYSWAPLLGIANCILCIGINIHNKAHVNNYVCQLALIILNVYFLTL